MVQLNPLRDLFWHGKQIPIYTLSKNLVRLAEKQIFRDDEERIDSSSTTSDHTFAKIIWMTCL